MTISKPGQVYIFQSGAWRGRGGRTIFPGYTAFDFSDVFAGNVIPYDPEWETPAGLDAAKYRPVGSRIPRASCTRVDVDTFTPAAGQEYVGLDIRCRVFQPATVSDGAFWMHDCYITPDFTYANAPTTDKAMAAGHNLDFGGALFEWVTFGGPPSVTSVWQNCIDGGNYRTRYCAFSRGTDAFHMNAVGNGVNEGFVVSHGRYGAWWNNGTSSPRTANYTDAGGTAREIAKESDGHSDAQGHSDGGQTAGYTGWVLRGGRISTGSRYSPGSPSQLDPTDATEYALINNFDADPTFLNAALIFNMDGVHKLGALVEYCLLAEGAATINLPWRAEDNGDGVTIKDTLIVPNGHGFQVYKQTATGSAAQTLTNVLRSDTRAAATVSTY